jgi:hypothetical protein
MYLEVHVIGICREIINFVFCFCFGFCFLIGLGGDGDGSLSRSNEGFTSAACWYKGRRCGGRGRAGGR